MQLTPHEFQLVQQVLDRHLPGKSVMVFGSRAQNQGKKYSDLDLVVMGNESLSLSVHANLAEDFDESDLVFKVDIVDWASLSETFRAEIMRNAVAFEGRFLTQAVSNP